MRKLFIDLDDVVLDTSLSLKRIKDYIEINRDDLGISEEDNMVDVSVMFLLDNYNRVPIKDGFLPIFDILKERYEIVFVSMYISEKEYAYKSFIARKLGVDIKLLSVSDYSDKSSIDMDGGVLIDDTLSMLTSSSATKKVLFTSKVNKLLHSVVLNRKYSVVSSWDEVYYLLEEEINGKEVQ